jgi:hypothetical protein
MRRTERHAFGGLQAFRNNNSDVVYEALQSVVMKTHAALNDLRKPPQEGMTSVWVALPVVVVDAPLFEAFWNPLTKDMALEPRDCVRLYWSGSQASDDPTAIDVVSAATLETYVTALKSGLNVFLEALHATTGAFLKRELENRSEIGHSR